MVGTGGMLTTGGNMDGGNAGMASTAQLIRGKTGAIVGTLPPTSHASTPGGI